MIFTLNFNIYFQVYANNGLDGVLSLIATPSAFYNECEITFKFEWKGPASIPSDVNIQVNFEKMLVSIF